MAGAGKDEIGKVFTEEYNFKRYAFGDAVKYDYANSIGANPVDMFNHNKNANRPGIIAHGEGKRKDNQRYWIDVVDKDIQENFANNLPVVITDIRRVAEIDYIRELIEKYGKKKVYLIKIERPEENGQAFDEDAETSKALVYAKFKKYVDFRVYNTSTQKVLVIQMKKIIDIIKNKK